jgi:hypothetical protein
MSGRELSSIKRLVRGDLVSLLVCAPEGAVFVAPASCGFLEAFLRF